MFAAASFTTFGLGAALFGAMILVPLYYQEVRGESVIATGLLIGPQGSGMLVAMPLAGRLTERFGGGRVALGGVSVLCLSTMPLAFIGANTSIAGDLARASRARRGHRLVLHARDDRRVRLDASRAALRRDAADERAAADRRRDRDGGAGRRAAARERRTHLRSRSWRARSTPPTGGRSGPPRSSLIPCVVLLRAENPRARLSRDAANAEAAIEPMGA